MSSGQGSQQGSQRGSQRGSPPGSEAGGSPRKASGAAKASPFPPSMGYDPARIDPKGRGKEMTSAEKIGKLVDLPPEAYHQGLSETHFKARPGTNTEGKPIQLQLNIFPVERLPRGDIYQYDVSVSPKPLDGKGLGLERKLWHSQEVKGRLDSVGGKWLYDYNKLAWCSKKLPKGEERISIHLDGADKAPTHYCVIKFTKVVRLDYLSSYLQGKASWDATVLECMTFFDHVIRQKPSEDMISIRRNYYAKKPMRRALGILLEVIKGTYMAFRLSDSILRGGTGLTVNVDVANTAFWQPWRLNEVALRLCNEYKKDWAAWDCYAMGKNAQPVPAKKKEDGFEMPEVLKVLRKLNKLKFTVSHRGRADTESIYTVKRVVWEPNKYGAEGAHARAATFDKKNADGTTTPTTVFNYYMERYGVRIEFPTLPVIETTRGALFPMDLCKVKSHERYMFKLDPKQTSEMIKIAVTRPNVRKADIMEGVDDLGWNKDQYLQAFDLPIKPSMVVTNARLLKNPEISFANGKIDPGVSGRWDLRGRKFSESNQRVLRSWGMIIIGDACEMHHLEAFGSQFSSVFRGHGGKIEKAPTLLQVPFSFGDVGKVTEYAHKEIGNRNTEAPAIIFFILSDKNSLVYERVKKNADCRFCVVSQVLMGAHVKKNQGQYCSNVAMKVNAKLGGVTCRILGPNANVPPFFKDPTMIVGLDVTHASPGSAQPSMAAMTVSTDKFATRYAGSCETNSWRVEVVPRNKIVLLLYRLLKYWVGLNGTYPRHVYFFRDGVSDGQFEGVLEEEVTGLKRCFTELKFPHPKFTVIIATKRHHIRFFPKPGDRLAADRNNNPLPGTLVERDATHPFHWDFYLCSHVAIQGTARPVHYIVIQDDANVNPNLLQKMIYHQCYQYCRSTTPVSLHPAVYYSHLASQRARAHEDIASSRKEMSYQGKEGFPIGKAPSEIYSGQQPLEPLPLLPMDHKEGHKENIQHINTTMWYV